MWEPVGPLPAAVYWRRRWVALASVITLAGLVAVGIGGRRAVDAPTPEPVPAAVRATVEGRAGGTASAIPPTVLGGRGFAEPTSPGAPSATASGVPSSAAPVGGAAHSAQASADPPRAASASTSSELIRPDDTPRPVVAAQAPVPVPRTGPVPCTNAMLSAGAEVEPAVHEVGSHPVLRLVITNISGQPCVRDLDAARQEIVVWSGDGADRLWSSNDCLNNPTTDLRTLVPGRPVAFSLTWFERTTTPGCTTPRTVVPAGSYRLMVRLDDLISPPTPFLRTA